MLTISGREGQDARRRKDQQDGGPDRQLMRETNKIREGQEQVLQELRIELQVTREIRAATVDSGDESRTPLGQRNLQAMRESCDQAASEVQALKGSFDELASDRRIQIATIGEGDIWERLYQASR